MYPLRRAEQPTLIPVLAVAEPLIHAYHTFVVFSQICVSSTSLSVLNVFYRGYNVQPCTYRVVVVEAPLDDLHLIGHPVDATVDTLVISLLSKDAAIAERDAHGLFQLDERAEFIPCVDKVLVLRWLGVTVAPRLRALEVSTAGKKPDIRLMCSAERHRLPRP